MNIRMTELSYGIGEDGKTEATTVRFVGSEGKNYLNITIEITVLDIEDGKTLDDLTRKDIEAIARQKVSNITRYPVEDNVETENI